MVNFSSFWVPYSKHQVSSLMVEFREGPRRYCPLWWSCRRLLCSRWTDPTSVGIPAYSVSSWRQCGNLSSLLSLSSFCLLIVGADDYCCIWSHQWQTHSVGPIWTRDRHVAETSDKTKHSQEKNTDTAGGIRTRNPNSQTATDPHLRPRGMWKLSAESPTHHANIFLPSDDN